MPPITPQKYLGIGTIVDVTNGIVLSTQGEFSCTPSFEVKKVPRGDTFGEDSIPINETYKGRFGFSDLTSQICAAITGGTVSTGHVLKWVSKEAVTVPGTPFQVTLAHQPYKFTGVALAPIEVIGANGVTYQQVATGPAVGEFMDAGTLKLTFASAVGLVYVSYFWEDTSAGVTVKANPSAIPTGGQYAYTGKLYSTRLRAFTGDLVVYVANLVRTGDAPFGTTVGEAAKFGFDWEATVTVPDDLAFHFPVA